MQLLIKAKKIFFIYEKCFSCDIIIMLLLLLLLMKIKFIIFFLVFLNQTISYFLKTIFQAPKSYVLNLKDDFSKLKFEKSSIMEFVRKHPFVSIKTIHSISVPLHNVYFCNCDRPFYDLMNIVLPEKKIYKDFFSYLTKFEKEYFVSNNFFSNEFVVSKKKYSRLIKYFHSPFLTFLTDCYSLCKPKPKKSFIELEEVSFIAPDQESKSSEIC